MNIIDNRIEIWPQPPRNFATEPATWNALMLAGLLLDPTHDYKFTMEFTITSTALPSGTTRYLLDPGSPVTTIFGAFYVNNGGLTCSCGLFKSSLVDQGEIAGESITLIPNTVGVPLALGIHVIECYAIGNSLYASIDGSAFVYAVSTIRRADLSILTKTPVTSHTGGVNKLEIFDLTTSEIKWKYPSRMEFLRLTTSTNIDATQDSFRIAQVSLAGKMISNVDLRGKVSDYTIGLDVDLVPLATPGQHQELAGQGTAYSAGTIAIASVSWNYYNATYGAFTVSTEVAGERIAKAFSAPIATFGRHIVFVTIAVDNLSAVTTIKLYLDGTLLGTQTAAGVPIGTASSSATNFTFMANSTIGSEGKLHDGVLLNEVLSEQAIKAQSHLPITVVPEIPLTRMEIIQNNVRAGTIANDYAVGDIIEVAHSTYGTLDFEVVGFDQVVLNDPLLTHSLVLMLKTSRIGNMMYDNAEPTNPDIERASNGNNRWAVSNIQQWLNSSAAANSWFVATHTYDAAPTYANAAGFMVGLPTYFTDVLAEVKVTTPLATVDGGGNETTVNKIFLPSYSQIMGGNDTVGVRFTKYANDTTAANRIKYDATSTATLWFLRDIATVDNSRNLHYIAADGAYYNVTRAVYERGIIPCCVIA